jgi:hypothetical protein
MTAKLFQTLVVSSALLLSTGCASVVRAGEDSGPDAVERDATVADRSSMPEPDAGPLVEDARVPEDTGVTVDASERDARQSEAGWPTTKGSFCEHPDAGEPFCCRTGGASSEGESSPYFCCLGDPPDIESCRRCTLDPVTRECAPRVADAGAP